MKKLILILTIIFCFNTAYSQFYNRETAPIIRTASIDTITNVEAAGILLILSGERPNKAIIDAGIFTGSMSLIGALYMSSISSNPTTSTVESLQLFSLLAVPASAYFTINYWVQTYKGNKYLSKAGQFLTIKGRDGYEKIDGKDYYIKYISK
jgi:uncharacterized protein YpbB